MTIYLDLSDLLAAAEAFLGHSPLVRDYGLLDSALARPKAAFYGEEAYPEFDAKAAALLVSVTNNHALVDGNKRLGWLATRYFYRLNGRDLVMADDDAYDLVMSIADGTQTDIVKVAEILGRHSHEK